MMQATDEVPKSAPVADANPAQAPAPEAPEEALDLDDAKVNQIAMRNEAVDHCKAFLDGGISEEDGKVIFDRYDQRGEGIWSPHDLRQFLFDLEEAFDSPRVVPDEVLADVIKELQLNPDAGHGLTWIDFKSYLIYLQQKPLMALHQLVQKTMAPLTLKNAVIIATLPKSVTKEAIFSHFSAHGSVAAVFLVEDNGTQSMVVYQNAASVAAACQHLNGAEFLGQKLHVVAYANQEFPTTIFKRKPSMLARGLGKAFISIRNVDEQHKISATIKQGVDTASSKVSTFMQEHKVHEKLKDASDKTTDALKKADEKLKVTATIQNINEKYQLSQKAQQAKEAAKVAGDRVMANPHVQKMGSFLAGVAGKAKSAYSEFAEDTRAVIAEEASKKAAANGGVAVEMKAPPAAAAAPAPAGQQ